MADFATVVVIAFLAQLAVLPGEKVQFIIAGLSTQYHPLGVVAAASAAFAGWTALEIWFGALLQRVLPTVVLDGITAGMFLLFAYLLARSASPGGSMSAVAESGLGVLEDVRVPVVGWKVPDAFRGYLPIFVLMAVGEFGDKTQLVTIGLAAQYGATSAIWFGEMLAIIPVSLLNAYLFSRFAHLLDAQTVHFAAAGLFAFFGLDTLLSMATGFSVWETAVEIIADLLVALV
ncbi:MAG: putative Ca2+/H+ antiporter (TMEM165/GDT1 family) [Natronomonas sp.]|jgi:putative Ca2+/H+ antiporter (TMEM165/GDT1 family)